MNSCRPKRLGSKSCGPVRSSGFAPRVDGVSTQKSVRRGRDRGRTDAVAPVVAVGEAAAGPANHAGLQRLELVHQRFADAADVGDLRLLADPDAVVDDAAEVFDEVAVEVGGDAADRFIEQDVEPRLGGLRGGAAGRLRERAG